MGLAAKDETMRAVAGREQSRAQKPAVIPKPSFEEESISAFRPPRVKFWPRPEQKQPGAESRDYLSAAQLIDELARELGDGVRKVIFDYAAAKGLTDRLGGAAAAKNETEYAAVAAEVRARGHSRLARAIERHIEERKHLPPPEAGCTNIEDARAAVRLANNFANLQARLKAAREKPLPPDEAVQAAQRSSKAFYRSLEVA